MHSKKMISYLFIGFIIGIMMLLFILYICRIHVYTLVSESMEPTLQEGSLLIQKQQPFTSLQSGDIITYKINNSDLYVTHRIVSINEEEKLIYCKGDANSENDEAISESQYQGSLLLAIPYVGYAILFLQNKWVKTILLLILLGWGCYLLYDTHKKRKV